MRSYKLFGLAALVAILIGLGAFLIVNIFYLFDNSWIRPVILDSAHADVVTMESRLSDERGKRNELRNLRDELAMEQVLIGEQEKELSRFAADHAEVAKSERGNSYAGLMARKALHEGAMKRTQLSARSKALSKRLKEIDASVARSDELIGKLEGTPYARAASDRVTLAFVPYANLPNVKEGDAVYGCKWGLVRCSQVGRIGASVPGEVKSMHPQSDKPMRGLMVELKVEENWSAKESALFVDGRPLWLF